MTSFKRTQRKYVQKAYRVRNWREYETGLRARGSLTVWLGLTDGKLANWNSPRPTRRKPGRQRRCFRHQLLLPRPYLVLTKPLRLDIQCQRGASVKIGWKYLDD